MWVPDFAVMTDCNKMVMATSSRELVFSDISTQNYKCQYRVHGMYTCPPISDVSAFIQYRSALHTSVHELLQQPRGTVAIAEFLK